MEKISTALFEDGIEQLRKTYPGIMFYKEVIANWHEILNREGVLPEDYTRAIFDIAANEQWYQNTALPPLVMKYVQQYRAGRRPEFQPLPNPKNLTSHFRGDGMKFNRLLLDTVDEMTLVPQDGEKPWQYSNRKLLAAFAKLKQEGAMIPPAYEEHFNSMGGF